MYRKIDLKIWGDKKFLALSERAKFLWFHLLTSPTALWIPGLVLGGPMHFAEALGWSVEAFQEAFQEVLDQGMAEADFKARLIWLPNSLKYNPPNSPNVVLAWRSAINNAPECELKDKVIRDVKAFLEGMSKGFQEAFREGIVEQKEKQKEKHKKKMFVCGVGTPGNKHEDLSKCETGSDHGETTDGPDETSPDEPREHPEGAAPHEPTSGQAGTSKPQATQRKSHAKTKGDGSPEAREVFEYWAQKLMPKAKPLPARLARIQARLDEGYAVEQLRQAVEGALLDDWIMGRDPKVRAGGFKDCDSVFRDGVHVERLIALAEAEKRKQAPRMHETKPIAKTNGAGAFTGIPAEAKAAIEGFLGGLSAHERNGA